MDITKKNLIRFILILGFPLFSATIFAQSAPKLIVGITVDQMRWDYLFRFEHRWDPNGGFRRLLEGGFASNNIQINYLPSYTACGHTAIYTGSVPAIHGITGNAWWDNHENEYTYCTEDSKVNTVGSTSESGKMSPKNLLTTTICDELKLAGNFRNKTIGIALKDRGSILPAGHSADAAYWYDSNTGTWITSTYYMESLPEWVKEFKTKEKVDSLYDLDWPLLYPAESYVQSIDEPKAYQAKAFGTTTSRFPHHFKKYEGNNYSILPATPHGNTLTTEFAKAAIISEQMGVDSIPDFLAISYSSTDYIGHAYGPNSLEVEDTYLRLDRELGTFFDFLDKEIGKKKWMVFLTADHGVAHVPGFMKEHKLPGGLVDEKAIYNQLAGALQKKFGVADLITGITNAQVILNIDLIRKTKKLKPSDVTDFSIEWLENQPGISRAVRMEDISKTTIPDHIVTQIKNAYMPSRCGQIQILYRSGVIEGFSTGGSTHGSGYGYDTHIPLLWYGWKIKPGQSSRKRSISDIAPTLAALLNIQEPSGSIGEVITEILDFK